MSSLIILILTVERTELRTPGRSQILLRTMTTNEKASSVLVFVAQSGNEYGLY